MFGQQLISIVSINKCCYYHQKEESLIKRFRGHPFPWTAPEPYAVTSVVSFSYPLWNLPISDSASAYNLPGAPETLTHLRFCALLWLETLYPRLALYSLCGGDCPCSWSSCLHPLSAGFPGLHYRTLCCVMLGMEPRALWALAPALSIILKTSKTWYASV